MDKTVHFFIMNYNIKKGKINRNYVITFSKISPGAAHWNAQLITPFLYLLLLHKRIPKRSSQVDLNLVISVANFEKYKYQIVTA